MPKKSFKDNPALAFIGTAQDAEPDLNSTLKTQEGSGITPKAVKAEFASDFSAQSPIPSPQKYYRLNLKLKAEFKEYLDRVSWEKHISITQYVNTLIEADMDTLDTQDT